MRDEQRKPRIIGRTCRDCPHVGTFPAAPGTGVHRYIAASTIPLSTATPILQQQQYHHSQPCLIGLRHNLLGGRDHLGRACLLHQGQTRGLVGPSSEDQLLLLWWWVA